MLPSPGSRAVGALPAWVLGLLLSSCSAAPEDPPGYGPGGGRGGSYPGSGGAAGTGGFPPGSGGSQPGSGGVGAGGSGVGGTGPGGSTGSPNTAPGFVNLAPPMGAPLDPNGGTSLTPPPPAGWTWYPIEGAICRDGSPSGIFVRFTASDKLFIYLEGGGACTNLGFCNYNPPNVNKLISGDGQTVLGSTLGVIDGRQQPGAFELGVVNGIFDTANAANPFKDWNAVYVPYCTGDVHAGTRTNATVPGVTAPQQFVGHLNMQKIIGRVVPTFQSRVNRVIITGASAGSYGAAMNFSMVQDAFGPVRLDALLDSGPPFSDDYMPACMQKRWRETWGFEAMLPPDCDECRQADGGGITKMADFLMRKHPNSTIALVSSMEDEVIRLFFSMGVKNCASFDTADPVLITTGQVLDPSVFYPAAQYSAGLEDLRARYAGTGRFATYLLGGANATLHQHTWRARFTDPAAGQETIASFVNNFLSGQFDHIAPK
jgi:hypothetical protein